MKIKDLLKYFMGRTNVKVFVIESEDTCGKSVYCQIFDEYNCGYKNIFENFSVKEGNYLVTYSPKGLNPSFIIIIDEVIRYFTLIEED